MLPFSRTQEVCLLALSIFGLMVPNGVFLYYTLFAPEVVDAAMANPVAMVFIAEAFLLMFLFAWVVHRCGFRSPGWLTFIVMSLIGSMLFSIPAFLYMASRKSRQE